MRTYDEIAADATDRRPFSNGTEFELWLSGNCYRSSGCVNESLSQVPNGHPCPLQTLAIVDQKTPKEWLDTDGNVGDCAEFVEVVAHATDDEPLDEDPDAAYGETWRPVETIKGQEGLF